MNNNIDVVQVFEDFFNLVEKIETHSIKAFVYEALSMLPEDFWIVPASSSGKHHADEDNVEPLGLLIHSIKAFAVAKGLFEFFGVNEIIEKDIIYAAILLHDSYKGGWKTVWDGTVPEHGEIAASQFEQIDLEPEYIKNKLLSCIRTHMSRWARPFSAVTEFVFPDKLNLIVALSDIVSSRKDISFYPGISILDLNEKEEKEID